MFRVKLFLLKSWMSSPCSWNNKLRLYQSANEKEVPE